MCRTVRAVSYTHLDVYKRQDEKWTEIIGGMTIYKDVELKTYLEPVSYTHLGKRLREVHAAEAAAAVLGALRRCDTL